MVVTALVSMATTLAVSKSIEGNATAINLAGALRMGAFQLLARSAGPAVPESGEDSISQMLDQYETRLADASITKAIPESHDHPLGAQYQAILESWQTTLRPALQEHDEGTPVSETMLASTQQYVDNVDQLVNMLEQRTEARIDLLHLIQIMAENPTKQILMARDMKTVRVPKWPEFSGEKLLKAGIVNLHGFHDFLPNSWLKSERPMPPDRDYLIAIMGTMEELWLKKSVTTATLLRQGAEKPEDIPDRVDEYKISA